MPAARTPERFVGYWRITEMEEWDAEYLDLVVPAFIEFNREQMGQFQFGTVRGWLDCRFGERDGAPLVEFSWEGENDNDPGCGRGWGGPRGTPRRAAVYSPRRRLRIRGVAERSACVAEAPRSTTGGSSSNLGIRATAAGRPRLIPTVERQRLRERRQMGFDTGDLRDAKALLEALG